MKCHHTQQPTNLSYGGSFEWAEKKTRRHKQTKCPNCGLWAIWIRRGKNELDYGGRKQ